MTANTTEKERADFEAWARDRYPSINLTRDRNDYSKALAKDYWSLWQAARRAPAVPVPQGVMDAVFTVLEGWTLPHQARKILETAYYAAPQPQEADHIPDTGKMVSVPVQLPEPDAWRYTDARSHFRYRGRRVGFAAEYPLLKPEPLYTEHQVLAILAQHGIKTK